MDALACTDADVEVVELSREEGHAMFDRLTRRELGMPADEFFDRLERGKLEINPDEHDAIARVMVALPFAR
ncbi:MAG: hypothetical protein ACR2F6_14140 [Mycobacteriales bacterium]